MHDRVYVPGLQPHDRVYLPGLRLHDCVYLPGLRLPDSLYSTGKFVLVSSQSMYIYIYIYNDGHPEGLADDVALSRSSLCNTFAPLSLVVSSINFTSVQNSTNIHAGWWVGHTVGIVVGLALCFNTIVQDYVLAPCRMRIAL